MRHDLSRADRLIARWRAFCDAQRIGAPVAKDFLAFGRLSTLERLRVPLARSAPDQCGPLRLAIADLKRQKVARNRPPGTGRQRGPVPVLSIPREELPAPWRALLDRQREARARADQGFLDLSGSMPPTVGAIRQTEYVLRALGFHCHAAGLPIEIAKEAVRAWLDAAEARGCRSTGLSLQLRLLGRFARDLGAPDDLVAALGDLAAMHAVRGRRRRKVKEERLIQAPLTLDGVWTKAEGLLEASRQLPAGRRSRVKLALDAACLALSVAAPLRIGDLHWLAIGRHLTRSATGWRIAIGTRKTGAIYERDLWQELTPFLDEVIRLDAPGGDLWAGYDLRSGGRLFSFDGGRTGAAADWVSSVWQERLGTGAHLVRTLWHELALDGEDDRTWVALALCGQRSEKTAAEYQLRRTRVANVRSARGLLRAARSEAMVLAEPRQR